jgi:hypothetical protein
MRSLALPVGHPYRKHSDNARLVLKGLTQAERAHKAAIGSGQPVSIDFAARVHHMTVGLVAETLLRKLVADPAGFNDRERSLLAQQRSQLDRWKRAVELAFRRHYAIPIHLEIDESSTTSVVATQYSELITLLEGDLSEIIEDRNKIAHGQWAWTLNNKETAFTGVAPPTLNYRAIQARSKLVQEIADLIGDLIVSEPTFVRDYTRRFNRVQNLRSTLPGADYPDLVKVLKASRR